MEQTTKPSEAPPQEEKAEPRRIAKPARRRPKSAYNEALGFIAVCIRHMEEKGTRLSIENIDEMQPLFRNYSRNTGLRGKERDTVWRIVKSQILTTKKDASKE